MYDKHFRSEMVMRKDNWSTVRFDLQLAYNINNKTKQTQKFQQKSKLTFKKINTCHMFNEKGKKCFRYPNCPYKHVCSSCSSSHPVFMCPNNPYRRQTTTGSLNGQSTQSYAATLDQQNARKSIQVQKKPNSNPNA